MPHARRLAGYVMGTLVASSAAFRPHFRQPRYFYATRLRVAKASRWCCLAPRQQQQLQQQQYGGSAVKMQPPSMLLGVDSGFGIVGLSAIGALRLFTSNISPKRVRVVTDIDDTVKSSGNKRLLGIPLGGIDAQYKRGTFYPGVFQFSLELSRYRVPSWQEPLSVAVLTARAREFLFALEIGDAHAISRRFRQCGDRNGLKRWGRGPVLYGSVKEWICPSRKSERKARNFGMLVEDDGQGGRGRPTGAEGGYIFIGDTGEGDPRAGEMMSLRFPERMRAVFLHVVSDAERQGKVTVPADRVVNGVPVVYFRTYVGAAVKAVGLGLMDRTGLENVVVAAEEAMSKVSRKSSKWADLNRDIAMAQAVEPLSPPLVVEALTLALDYVIAPKTKLEGVFERKPVLSTTASKGAGSVTNTTVGKRGGG